MTGYAQDRGDALLGGAGAAISVGPISEVGPSEAALSPIAISRVPEVSVAANLASLHRRIESAGGDPGRIRVVAVTKGFGNEAVRAALATGIHDLGENYAQELAGKVAAIGARRSYPAEGAPGPSRTSGAGDPIGDPIRWHFLGPVQRNKVATLAGLVDWWHGVDSLAIGEAIARRQPGAHLLVQVNASGESTKHGCRPEETSELVAQLRRLPLDVAGLMTIGPAGPAERARVAFRMVAGIGRTLGLRELSMGMTDDLEVAVQEGATMVRIGRGLFGPRDKGGVARDGTLVNGGD